MMRRIPQELARAIDLTEVRKDLTYRDVERSCFEARNYGIASVVVPSALVRRAATCLSDSDVAVMCYVGYPFGTQAPGVKAREAHVALEQGAREIELVPHHGAIRAGRWSDVERELEAVRGAVKAATLGVVVEAAYLSDEQLSRFASVAADVGCVRIANTAGFRVVSTRPDSQVAATEGTVARLAHAGRGRILPKAVGGIYTRGDAARLIGAGAARVGVDAVPGLLRRWAEEKG